MMRRRRRRMAGVDGSSRRWTEGKGRAGREHFY